MVISCDHVSGPIVRLGESALMRADASIVLPYVLPEDERELAILLAASRPQLTVPSSLSGQFIEWLVQRHAAAEGAQFSGIRYDGPESSPAVTIAERALESGYDSALARLFPQAVHGELSRRFRDVHAMHIRAHELSSNRDYILSLHRFLTWVDRETSPKNERRPWA